jgi:V-type H+-transporting ATPase subunit a
MITMMIFYSGFTYHNLFYLGLNLFGSRWYFYGNDKMEVQNGADNIQTTPYGNPESVSPFGLDPLWKVTPSELLLLSNHGHHSLPLVSSCSFSSSAA